MRVQPPPRAACCTGPASTDTGVRIRARAPAGRFQSFLRDDDHRRCRALLLPRKQQQQPTACPCPVKPTKERGGVAYSCTPRPLRQKRLRDGPNRGDAPLLPANRRPLKKKSKCNLRSALSVYDDRRIAILRRVLLLLLSVRPWPAACARGVLRCRWERARGWSCACRPHVAEAPHGSLQAYRDEKHHGERRQSAKG